MVALGAVLGKVRPNLVTRWAEHASERRRRITGHLMCTYRQKVYSVKREHYTTRLVLPETEVSLSVADPARGGKAPACERTRISALDAVECDRGTCRW